MANMNAPTGLWPTGTLTGAAYNEQGRLYYIANDATNTYAIGDVVTIKKGGDINGVPQCVKATAASTPLGVVVGFEVSVAGPSLQGTNLNLAQIYLSLNSGSQYAYVVDDPNAIFKVVATNGASTTTATAYSRALVGSNVSLATATGSTATGDSYYGINGASADTTNTLPIRVVDVVPDTATGSASASATTYYEFLVKFNLHQYTDTTGI